MYRSGNPWKNVCPFTTITSSSKELGQEVERMEGVLSQLDKDREAKPRAHPVTKWENSMRAMVKRLREEILPKVEQEEIRQTKKRKQIEVRQNYIALHELRETRTRRQTQRPRYVYEGLSEDEDNNGDDFVVQDDEDYDSEEPDRKRPRGSRTVLPTRSSGRLSAANAVKEHSERETRSREWRGERRSSRFGGPSLDDPESVAGPSSPITNGTTSEKQRSTEPPLSALDDDELGAQAIFDAVNSKNKKRKEDQLRDVGGASKPRENEVVVEAPKGKRSGKFWFYAVEPVNQAGTLEIPDPPDIRRRPRKSRPSLLRVESDEQSREASKEPSEATTSALKEEEVDMDPTESRTLTNGSGSRHDAYEGPAKSEAASPQPMDVEA